MTSTPRSSASRRRASTSHQSFIANHNLNVPLVADADLEVAEAYGIKLGTSLRRAVFIVDPEGRIAHRDVKLVGLSFTDSEAIAKALNEARAARRGLAARRRGRAGAAIFEADRRRRRRPARLEPGGGHAGPARPRGHRAPRPRPARLLASGSGTVSGDLLQRPQPRGQRPGRAGQPRLPNAWSPISRPSATATLGDGESAAARRPLDGRPHSARARRSPIPQRYAGLVVIGPVSQGEQPPDSALGYWDGLADGLESGGVEGWLAAYERGDFDPEWRETLMRIARQRMEVHEHPEALADALREVPRSVPYEGLEPLAELDLPALVVASHDEADPGHPYETAELIAEPCPRRAWSARRAGREPARLAGRQAEPRDRGVRRGGL